MQSKESFKPGQYTYPFTLKVPTGVPGTYCHGSGAYSNRAECSVTYSIYCELVTHTEMIGRSMCPIVIMQHARKALNYNLESNIDQQVTTWGCQNKGSVNLKCVFEKDIVRTDESVMMRFTADLTNCKVDVLTLRCELKRKLTLRTRAGAATYRETNMISLPVNGVMKGEKTEHDKTVQFDLNYAVDLGTPSNLTGSLGEFAGKIQQTCNGQLVNCQYELHVTTDIDG